MNAPFVLCKAFVRSVLCTQGPLLMRPLCSVAAYEIRGLLLPSLDISQPTTLRWDLAELNKNINQGSCHQVTPSVRVRAILLA